ncbi:hypothetical protein FRB90_005177 [Tulasnella sp. 427]|nr:hypothetical protein FRB90_005177 [Tulasnella sp. 427]
MSGNNYPANYFTYPSSSRYATSQPTLDDQDYDDHPSYPPPQAQYNPAYGHDMKPSSSFDDGQPQPPAPSESLYPPVRTHPYPFDHSQTSLRPSVSTDMSSKPGYGSSIEVDTLGTVDSERAIRKDTLEIKHKDLETGWRAFFWPSSKTCQFYLLAVVVETFLDVLIEGIILQQLDIMADSVPKKKAGAVKVTQTRQPVYLGIFVLAHFLQLVLALDAVYNKNTLQFLFLAFFNFSLLLYGSLQIVEVNGNITQMIKEQGATAASVPVNVLLIVVPIVIAIAEVFYIGLGYKIWREFGWKIYKFLGADRTIKKIYANYQVFQCLLKFDIFFWVGFSIQWIMNKKEKEAKLERKATGYKGDFKNRLQRNPTINLKRMSIE